MSVEIIQMSIPISGTPDSFLVLNVFSDPTRIVSYLEIILPNIYDKLESDKHRPDVMFFSDRSADDKASLAYLRCPSINGVEPFTPEIRAIAETIDPNVNIVKILRYEDGSNSINPHSDKTIDLDATVPIYNIRFGAPRKFVLEHKVTGEKITTVIPHNAMFVLGLKTNLEWTHSIPPESDINDRTYSIVLRKSVTFKDNTTGSLWGVRTPFPKHSDLMECIENNGLKANRARLAKLWEDENLNIVDSDHYKQYCSEIRDGHPLPVM